jgi:hypothetical protein
MVSPEGACNAIIDLTENNLQLKNDKYNDTDTKEI